eukprot:4855269-Amphidinium_carterae.1
MGRSGRRQSCPQRKAHRMLQIEFAGILALYTSKASSSSKAETSVATFQVSVLMPARLTQWQAVLRERAAQQSDPQKEQVAHIMHHRSFNIRA